MQDPCEKHKAQRVIKCAFCFALELPQQVSNSSCNLILDKLQELNAPTFSVHVLPVLPQAHLKVAAADEEVDLALLPHLQALQSGVDGVQLAMAAPFHGNLQGRPQLELGSRKCCKKALAAA